MRNLTIGLMAVTTVLMAVMFINAPVFSDDQDRTDRESIFKTLDHIPPTWDQILRCSNPKKCPRFELVMGGVAVLDKETGLVWEQSPSSTRFRWNDISDFRLRAAYHCDNLSVGNRKGWRLPTVQELASLIDPSVAEPGPTLPAGNPFTNVQSDAFAPYWTATSFAGNPEASAWNVYFHFGLADLDDKRVAILSVRAQWATGG